ncbi:type II toxin-antitoxin system RelE/ParE family toxin [Muribacter muris]|uniref:Type II toxin-antitoxin system RelE/ParE family toxin n=1 Tax=Muribacter muris TaxID=67855 RepID=A0A4Y9JQU1_9PAST|nr:type II toxin-antitoxin system RelE/ParE family toxin [Muribacter muris]MBF0785985.1 type II toxin-antitoxin system RelE/ParE family toxin [Muribacter muris]MBF0826068.1 type II toxin-antitoxin system RelE/ParE family toxin [Muribacter muris]TFV08174.1 type II toxin-antitoxin system RelE/ParE family toxin [Muribacter muris]
MANVIQLTTKADKQLSRIDSRYQTAIIKAIEQLADFPSITLDIRKLKGQESQYRARVGRYRILFEWIDGSPKIIEIQAVLKRDEQTYQ